MSLCPMAAMVDIFKIEVTPALQGSWLAGPKMANGAGDCRQWTHKTPMLMANRAPIFSFLSIATCHTIFHGSSARMMSMVPE